MASRLIASSALVGLLTLTTYLNLTRAWGLQLQSFSWFVGCFIASVVLAALLEVVKKDG